MLSSFVYGKKKKTDTTIWYSSTPRVKISFTVDPKQINYKRKTTYTIEAGRVNIFHNALTLIIRTSRKGWMISSWTWASAAFKNAEVGSGWLWRRSSILLMHSIICSAGGGKKAAFPPDRVQFWLLLNSPGIWLLPQPLVNNIVRDGGNWLQSPGAYFNAK